MTDEFEPNGGGVIDDIAEEERQKARIAKFRERAQALKNKPKEKTAMNTEPTAEPKKRRGRPPKNASPSAPPIKKRGRKPKGLTTEMIHEAKNKLEATREISLEEVEQSLRDAFDIFSRYNIQRVGARPMRRRQRARARKITQG
jgi:hypothetical protein